MKFFVVCLVGVLISSFVSSTQFFNGSDRPDQCYAISIKETFDSEIIMVTSRRHCPRNKITSIQKIQVFDPNVLCKLIVEQIPINQQMYRTEIYIEKLEKSKRQIKEEILASCDFEFDFPPSFIEGNADNKWYEKDPLNYLKFEGFATYFQRTFVTYEKQNKEMIIYKSENDTIIPKKTVSLKKLYENCETICNTESPENCYPCVDGELREILPKFKFGDNQFNIKFESTMWISEENKSMMNYFMKYLIKDQTGDLGHAIGGYYFNVLPTQL